MIYIPRDYDPSRSVVIKKEPPSPMMQATMRDQLSEAMIKNDMKRAGEILHRQYDLETNNDLGLTALHEAVICGKADFVLLLVTMGARTYAINPMGQTVWDVATTLKEPHCLKALELGIYFYQQKYEKQEAKTLATAFHAGKADKAPEKKPEPVVVSEADEAEARRAALLAMSPKQILKLKK